MGSISHSAKVVQVPLHFKSFSILIQLMLPRCQQRFILHQLTTFNDTLHMIFCSNQRGKKSVIHHTHLWHMNSYFIWKELSQKLCCLWHFLPPVTKSSKTILKISKAPKSIIRKSTVQISHNIITYHQLATYMLLCERYRERQREEKRELHTGNVIQMIHLLPRKRSLKFPSLSTRHLETSTKMKRTLN